MRTESTQTSNKIGFSNLQTIELIKKDRDPKTPEFLRKRIRTEIYNRYVKFVYKIASRIGYSNKELYTQIESAGLEALITAIDEYDYRRGSFSTWAYTKIRFAAWEVKRAFDYSTRLTKNALTISHTSSVYDDDSSKGFEIDVAQENDTEFKLTQKDKAKLLKIIEEVCSKDKTLTRYCIIISRFGLDGEQVKSNRVLAKEYGITESMASTHFRKFKQQALKLYGKDLREMYVA